LSCRELTPSVRPTTDKRRDVTRLVTAPSWTRLIASRHDAQRHRAATRDCHASGPAQNQMGQSATHASSYDGQEIRLAT